VRRIAGLVLMLVMIAGPLFATTRKDIYDMPCSALRPAVKGTVRNSGSMPSSSSTRTR